MTLFASVLITRWPMRVDIPRCPAVQVHCILTTSFHIRPTSVVPRQSGYATLGYTRDRDHFNGASRFNDMCAINSYVSEYIYES